MGVRVESVRARVSVRETGEGRLEGYFYPRRIFLACSFE